MPPLYYLAIGNSVQRCKDMKYSRYMQIIFDFLSSFLSFCRQKSFVFD